MSQEKLFPHPENTHRPVTNYAAGRQTSQTSPSNRALRWSATNTQWQTATSRSHYKPFDRISQRVF